MTYQNEKDVGYIDLILAQIEERGQQTAIAIAESKEKWTYLSLKNEVERRIGLYTALGLWEGDRVLLLIPNGVEFIFSFLALSSMGICSICSSDHLKSFELASILEDSLPSIVVTSALCLREHARAFCACKTIKEILLIDGDEDLNSLKEMTSLGLFDIIAMQAEASLPRPFKAPRGNPVISMHFTYKGTGNALGIRHRYDDYKVSNHGIANNFSMKGGDQHLVLLPLYAVLGLLSGIMMPLSRGCEIVLASPQANFPALFREYNFNFAVMVPKLLEFLLRYLRQNEKIPFHKDLVIITGGSHLDREIERQFIELAGIRPFQCYGTTEVLAVTSNSKEHYREGSIGKALHEAIEIYVLDEKGRPCKPHRVGEICIKTPAVSHYFDRKHGESSYFFRGGFFHSGDLGRIDQDGFLYFEGRRESFTKINSKMVDLKEIEAVLTMHKRVERAKVRVKYHLYNESLEATTIIRTGDFALDPRELQNFLASYLSPHKIPREVLVVNAGEPRGSLDRIKK